MTNASTVPAVFVHGLWMHARSCEYLIGFSAPSVTEVMTTLLCSPRSKKAGRTRLPTFSITTTEPAGESRTRRPAAIISASRWHPAPRLI